jgi:hypothetical protein
VERFSPLAGSHGGGHIGVARAGSKLTEVTAAVVEFVIEGAADSVRSPRLSRQQRLEGHDREAT